MSGVVEERTGTEAPCQTSGTRPHTARPSREPPHPLSLLTRTVGDDGSIQWQVARPRRRWRVMTVAAVAAAGLGVGYFAIARDERAVNTTSRAAPAPSALARPAAAGRVVAPARPINTAPSAGADSAPAVEAATTAGLSGTGTVHGADCGRANRSRGRATPRLACQGGLLSVPGAHDDRTRPPPPSSSGPTALAGGGAGRGRSAWRSGLRRALDHRRRRPQNTVVGR